MPSARLPIFAGLLLAGFAHAADPAVGATKSQVEAELGRPTATRKTADGEISSYPRGTVSFQNDRAVELKIVPRDEYEARLAAEKRAAEAFRERKAKLDAARAKRLAEVEAARDALIAQDAYRQLSPEGRIERLDRFRTEYPDADVSVLRADLARLVAEKQLGARRESDAERFRKDAEERLKQTSASLADTRTQLAEAGARLVALEEKLTARDKDIEDLKKRLDLAEKLIRLYAPAGNGATATAPGAAPVGGFSDSGPSH